MIYGEVAPLAGVERTAPKGNSVTLLHCFVSNRFHDSAGTDAQTFFAHRAFFGDAFLPANGERLNRASLRFSGLSGWASDVTGLTRVAAAPFSRTWVQPEPIQVRFPRGLLALAVGASAPSRARRWAIEEDAVFRLTYHSPVSDSELSKDVWALQNLLTFATDRPNALTRLEVEQASDTDTSPLTVIGPPVFDDESAAEGVMPHDLLFGHAEVGDRFEEVIRRWFEMSERRSPEFAIYFGLRYNPPRYSDLRFQLMAQTLSLYHTSGKAGGNGTRNILPYNFADALEPVVRDELVRTHPLVVLANALRTLTDRYAVVFDPLIGASGEGGRVPFLELATRTFQYVLGRESGAPEGSRGATYYWLTELFGFLWKAALLDELGFTAEEQQRLLARNRMYQHIRHQVAAELFGGRKPGL